MAYELVAQGAVVDVAELGNYESYLEEGRRGLLELDLRLPVSQSVAANLEGRLRQLGVTDAGVTASGSMLRISFRKGMPWLVVIAAAVLGMITLAILIMGWRIFREVMAIIPDQFKPTVVLAFVLIAVLIAVAGVGLTRRY